ncbi:MAG: hypothetical protein EOM64_04485, partial [Erysipelotrichia bacterium]|nr:hypothetical protein [Erysipelotrichia bacterium]
LKEQYQLVYNRKAAPGAEDNRLEFLLEHNPNARGLAIILKKDGKDGLTWLEEPEAREIIAQFSNMKLNTLQTKKD